MAPTDSVPLFFSAGMLGLSWLDSLSIDRETNAPPFIACHLDDRQSTLLRHLPLASMHPCFQVFAFCLSYHVASELLFYFPTQPTGYQDTNLVTYIIGPLGHGHCQRSSHNDGTGLLSYLCAQSCANPRRPHGGWASSLRPVELGPFPNSPNEGPLVC